jgi:oxidase EvaA
VQATLSNYQRVHRGRPTPMIEYFVGDRPAGVQCLSDSLQSEQGDRFLGKFNRNLVMAVPWHQPVVDAPAWRWFSASAVKQALVQDYAVNTDARSVMVCSPWDWLADDPRGAFARWQGRGGLGEALFQSVKASGGVVSLLDLPGILEDARRRYRFERQACSLSSLPGWHGTAMGLFPTYDDADASSVQTFAVRASEREVPRWSQPLLVGGRCATVTLLCTRWDGIMHVLLRLAPEPGFKDHVQLGPSDIDAPPHHRLPWVQGVVGDPSVRYLVSAHQSDEGGRFMHSLARYEVREVEASQVPRHDPDAVWLTLIQVQTLAQQSGLLTNEARSVLSLLLGWA